MYSESYLLYIYDMLCPVAPEKFQTKITGKNKTVTLINEGDINILKNPGLTEITFDLLLPNVEYPFAVYRDGFVDADYFLKYLKKLKSDKNPFRMMLIRQFPGGNDRPIFSTSLTVALENYTVTDEYKNGFDVMVSVQLKQYKSYGIKTYKVVNNKAQTKSTPRNTSTSPAPKNNNKTYTVKSGDCLWNIAKYFYGDGSKFTVIRDANKSVISKHGSDPNMIWPGDVLVIPAL